jgi:hypothetical protein
MNRRLLAMALVLALVSHGSASIVSVAQDASLRIVVIEGEDAVNIVDKKTAVKPVVEVRDRNDLPVAGVSVRFAIDGQGAVFNNGLRQLIVTTNNLGRATVSQLSPLGRGALRCRYKCRRPTRVRRPRRRFTR